MKEQRFLKKIVAIPLILAIALNMILSINFPIVVGAEAGIIDLDVKTPAASAR